MSFQTTNPVGPFEACTTGVDPLTGDGTFGDYESTTFTPYATLESYGPGVGNLQRVPLKLTTFTLSTQCVADDDNQFIEGVTW